MYRFGDHSSSNIDEAVEKSIPDNTKRSKESIWRQFLSFCEEKKYIVDASVSIPQIAFLLRDWAFNMRKQNGEDYKETVVKLMWNSTAKQLQEMFFINFHIKFDPFSDIVFKSARDARDAKRRNLQVDPRKRKSSSVALSNEELSKMVAIWDEHTPTGLQRKFFHIAGYELAWRGGEGRNTCVHHFTEEKNDQGLPTGRIEYNPLFTKTTQGGGKKLADSKWLVSNTTNADICPVRMFKKLLEKRTKSITTENLFLAPNPTWKSVNSKGWYKNAPVGRNTMSTWTTSSADMIGINTKINKITNHSMRATAVSHLAKAGVGEEQLIKLTGHSNTHSIRPYLQMDKDHHQKIVEAMRNTENKETETCITTNLSSTKTLSDASQKHVVTYNNCVFNFH